jgi:2-dehydro-3-deoxyphosphooctonate aldolase (KDO 8-P synthase)
LPSTPYFVGALKGAGKAYLKSAINRHSRYAWGRPPHQLCLWLDERAAIRHVISARHVTIGGIEIGNDKPLTLIAGPCPLESRVHALEMSHALTELASEFGMGLIYMSSFQWPDRTSLTSDRGIGMKQALPILAEVRETYGCPMLTDVHDARQCPAVAEAVDVLQIPASLCRQSDLFVAAAEIGRAVNVKKGQFLAPWDMRNVAAKI